MDVSIKSPHFNFAKKDDTSIDPKINSGSLFVSSIQTCNVLFNHEYIDMPTEWKNLSRFIRR